MSASIPKAPVDVIFRRLAHPGSSPAGAPPSLAQVQAYFESYWKLETSNRLIRFGEKDTKDTLLDLTCRMLEVVGARQEPELAGDIPASGEPLPIL